MKQLIMLSLPNMGTDWLAGVMANQNPALVYFREFFNPVVNLKYGDLLNLAFGSELVSSYHLIACQAAKCKSIYMETWQKEKYNFTKENYSIFKVDFFAKNFDCFVLTRGIKFTFPPIRLHVWAWYDAIYASLLANQHLLETDIQFLIEFSKATANTMSKKYVAACAICTYKLKKDAIKLHLPMIEYEQLMALNEDELTNYVSILPGIINPAGVAKEIVATRKPRKNLFHILEIDDFLVKFNMQIESIKFCPLL